MTSDKGILWTSEEACAVTGGSSTRPWIATGMSMNMTDLKPGDLYVATREDDIDAVFAAGAAAVMVSGLREIETEFPVLIVGGVFEALQNLAAHARHRTHATIVAAQGMKAQNMIVRMLSNIGKVHTAGRHLSLGLASVCEESDFGVFGLSPKVRPDVAMISDCAVAHTDSLFECFPPGGVVLINADDDASLSVMAQAKAAGIRYVLSYGSSNQADLRLVRAIEARDGTQVHVDMMGQEDSFVIPPGVPFDMSILAVCLVLKMRGCPLSVLGVEENLNNAQDGNLTLFASQQVRRGTLQKQAVFKISKMIDLGYGRQTAVLDNVCGRLNKKSYSNKGFALPRQLDQIDLVCTGRRIETVHDPYQAIRKVHKNAAIEQIVTDVLAPGDFVVFRDLLYNSRALFSQALRLVPGKKTDKTDRKEGCSYAL